MIYVSLILSNPFCKNWKILKTKNFSIFKFKNLEFNFYKTSHIICFEFEIRCNCNHEGIRLSLGLLGYNIEFDFYDSRHK